jgi:hypothetical protein
MKKQLTTDEMQEIIDNLQQYLASAKAKWDIENAGKKSWFKISQRYLLVTTKFLVDCLDELINLV